MAEINIDKLDEVTGGTRGANSGAGKTSGVGFNSGTGNNSGVGFNSGTGHNSGVGHNSAVAVGSFVKVASSAGNSSLQASLTYKVLSITPQGVATLQGTGGEVMTLEISKLEVSTSCEF